MNLDELERIAKAAQARSPGEWRAVPGSEYHDDRCSVYSGPLADAVPVTSEIEWVATAQHIAAFSPDVVLELIARLRQAEEARDGALRAIARAADEHGYCKVALGIMERDVRSGGRDHPTCMHCYVESGDPAPAEVDALREFVHESRHGWHAQGDAPIPSSEALRAADKLVGKLYDPECRDCQRGVPV